MATIAATCCAILPHRHAGTVMAELLNAVPALLDEVESLRALLEEINR